MTATSRPSQSGDIGKHDVDPLVAFNNAARLMTAAGRDHFVAGLFQNGANGGPNRLFVVDEQHRAELQTRRRLLRRPGDRAGERERRSAADAISTSMPVALPYDS
jgi:hypothetical protein